MTVQTFNVPDVLWAQRSQIVYVTFNVPDITTYQLELEENDDTLLFTAQTSSDKQYQISLQLYGPIAKDQLKQIKTGQNLQLTLTKHEDGWWPRLLKDGQKHRWLKTDFSKWQDEDDEDDQPDQQQEPQMPFNMGGAGGAGGFDMSQFDMSQFMQQQGQQEEEEEEEVDSDDELPRIVE